MAQQDTYRYGSSSPRYGLLPIALDGEGIFSFLDWITSDGIVYGPDEEQPRPQPGHHQETVFHTPVGSYMERGEYVGKCLLDYVFFWLTHGTAGRDCLTFEAYLLVVIAIVHEYYAEEGGGQLHSLRTAHGSDFPVFLFNPEFDEDRKMHEGAEGYRHPALNRETFEFYKVRIAREDDERRMERQLLAIRELIEAIDLSSK